ncbi:hypothetical protein RZS08_24010, partial [Arthrospira platensis SPKY1]|nr:hypothetical protein [Arthrospira platensis SPKY1]
MSQGICPRQKKIDDENQRIAEVARLERERREAEHRKKYTFGALLDAYINHQKKVGRRWKEPLSAFRHVPESLRDIPAKEITADHIRDIILPLTGGEKVKGRMAGLVRSYLHSAFNLSLAARYDGGLSD